MSEHPWDDEPDEAPRLSGGRRRGPDDDFSPFELFGSGPSRKTRIAVTAIACVSALALLGFVLLVAVYALNVGTIWSSQPAAAASIPAVKIINGSGSTVAVLEVDSQGFTRRLARLAPGGVASVRVPRSARCLRGSLIALNARNVEEGRIARVCSGDTWQIG